MASKVEKREFDQYLSEARSWETNRVMALEQSRRVAWIIASVALFLAIAAVIAVMLLTPLKTVQPFMVRVDNSTGIVDTVTALKHGNTNYDEVMNKYHIQRYVRWREGYSKPLLAEYYNNVGLMSSAAEQQKYFGYITPQNPSSPLNTLKEIGSVTIKIKSTSFINPNVALVRYLKEVRSGSTVSSTTHWAATVIFQYVGTPMSERDREVNPLGFQVIEYRNDPDQAVAESSGISGPAMPAGPGRGETLFPQHQVRQPEVPAIQLAR